jgi:cytochrome c553
LASGGGAAAVAGERAAHRLEDYAGKPNAELEDTLSGMVGGRIDHPKKLALSEADVRNLAAYISSSGEAK